MLVLSAGAFFISSSFLNHMDKVYADLYEGTHVDISSQLLGSYVLESLSPSINNESRHDLTQLISKETSHLSFHLRRLVLLQEHESAVDVCPNSPQFYPPADALLALLTSPLFAAFNVHNYTPLQESADVLSFWSLGLRHAQLSSIISRVIAADDVNLPQSSINTFISSIFTVFSSLEVFYQYVVELSSSVVVQSILYQVAAATTILIIIVVMGVGLFGRALTKISEERQAILNLFLYIPRSEILKILNDQKFAFMKRRQNHVQTMIPINLICPMMIAVALLNSWHNLLIASF
ncbi:hypothetical protein GEMRC1_010076 [Eukaryota sp. GEM-RC1]